VHLDRDQQERTHAKYWDALHQFAFLVVSSPAIWPALDALADFSSFTTFFPVFCSASASASDIFDLVTMSFRLMPKWTMVCAICGRMPLMMHSAPIKRAAVMVFSKCCATSVSTVGTPVISMMAILEFVSTTVFNRDSITTCVRAL